MLMSSSASSSLYATPGSARYVLIASSEIGVVCGYSEYIAISALIASS